MKIVYLVLIGLLPMAAMMPGAHAQQTLQQRFPWMFHGQNNPKESLNTTITLVQKLQPVMRSYPGVAADVLGIRPGMTVSQAEAIAAKSYPVAPKVERSYDSFKYKEVTVRSQPFISYVDFRSDVNETQDALGLYFNGTVSGNTLYGIGRDIQFGANGKFGDPAAAPLMSTLESSIIKKYGPPSDRLIGDGYAQFAWGFSQKSRVACSLGSCVPNNPAPPVMPPVKVWPSQEELNEPSYMAMRDMNSLDMFSTSPSSYIYESHRQAVNLRCGMGDQTADELSSLKIWVNISAYQSDPTKAREMWIAVWDPSTCVADIRETENQIQPASIKFYKTVSKAPAAPKF